MYKALPFTFIVALLIGLSQPVSAEDHTTLTLGVGGYDVVSYHTENKAQRGSGYHAAEHKGITYIFKSEDNLKAFNKEPERYLPAYGGYCAYGVAVGKKFASNPEIWKIVDKVLYLNLDKDIQNTWNKDIKGYIKTGDKNWKKIEKKAPKDL